MKNAISATALDSAITKALLSAGVKDYAGDADTAMLLSSHVEQAERAYPDVMLDLWRGAAAVIDPLIELVAAIASNPLGDNSKFAKEALKSIERRIVFQIKDYIGDLKPEARRISKSLRKIQLVDE